MANDSMLLGRDALALFTALGRYWPRVERETRAELRHWRLHAAAIADARLRRLALDKLDDQRANALAAATFATLVGRSQRQRAARLIVAFQVMYDYLDAVSEERAPDRLCDGRQLHRALVDVFDRESGTVDYYAHHPQHDDSGYLAALVTTCRARFAELPSAAAVAGAAGAVADRCGESQTRTHAVGELGVGQLADWAVRCVPADGYEWWELAAGAASSLTIHALIALAAQPRVEAIDVSRVEAVYSPAIAALSTLLDSLADFGSDDPGRDHRYIAYYGTDATKVAQRLAEIAHDGATAARCLPGGSRHVVIVAGIACFYVTGSRPRSALMLAAAPRIRAQIGPLVWPVAGIVKSLRIVHGERRRG